MRYAIIVWATESDVINTNGTVYGWYESLATAINTATNLRQSNPGIWQATVVKMV